MMRQSRDRQIAGTDSAPLQDAEQKDISFQDSVTKKAPQKYFPDTMNGINITISSSPDVMYDIWGNKIKTTSSITLKEEPVYMVFNHKPTALMLTRKQFQYQRKSNIISEPENSELTLGLNFSKTFNSVTNVSLPFIFS